MSQACLEPEWTEALSTKIVTPHQAVDQIPSGGRIFLGSGAAPPTMLIQSLADPGYGPDDAEIIQILTLGDAPTAGPEFIDRYRHNALFIGPNMRHAVNDGRADYTPIHLHEIPYMFKPGGRLPIDAALVQVSPPDRSGYVSLGVSIDAEKTAVDNAKRIIAEVNPHMPRTHGDTFIHVDQIDAVVLVDTPLPELRIDPPGEVEMQIGRHVAELIEDGATLQLGIGKIPDAVLASLSGHKDLGVHTEMLSDGVIDLVESGVVNCSRKTLHRGKIVASFAMGTKRLYEFIDDNPQCEFRPCHYVNDPTVIAKNDDMIAINSALQIDLTGQVCADSQGTRFYSGVGGQVDFIRGAAMSKRGKPIIALPSTAKGGTISRIAPHLAEGAGVVTTRADVHYVVTEFGIAYLHGRTVRERVMELINIAHPKFRDELFEKAREMGYLFRDQSKGALLADYPDDREHAERLKDGTVIRLRPLRASDEPRLRDMFRRCSAETVHSRFQATVRSIGHADLQQFMDVDYRTSYAQVVMVGDPGSGQMIGLAEYHLIPETGMADVAFTIEDDWQHRGIGTILLRDLMDVACSNGVAGFLADVDVRNAPMIKVFHRCGHEVHSSMENGTYHLEIPFRD